jgi:hypothetical protein
MLDDGLGALEGDGDLHSTVSPLFSENEKSNIVLRGGPRGEPKRRHRMAASTRKGGSRYWYSVPGILRKSAQWVHGSCELSKLKQVFIPHSSLTLSGSGRAPFSRNSRMNGAS